MPKINHSAHEDDVVDVTPRKKRRKDAKEAKEREVETKQWVKKYEPHTEVISSAFLSLFHPFLSLFIRRRNSVSPL